MDKDRMFNLRARRAEAEKVLRVFESEECQYVLKKTKDKILKAIEEAEPEAVMRLKHDLDALNRVKREFLNVKAERDMTNKELEVYEG